MSAIKKVKPSPSRPALVPGYLTQEHEAIKKLGRPTPDWVMKLSRFAGNPVFLPYIAYSPFAIAALIIGHNTANHSPIWTALIFTAGLLSWTLVEYVLHRFVFHASAESPIPTILWKWTAEIHLEHHHEPSRPSRIASPALLSLPYFWLIMGTYSVLGGAYYLARGWEWNTGLGLGLIAASGLAFGFMAYEAIHAMTHLVQVKEGPFGFLKRYHLLHHFRNPDRYFGVSSPFWDKVFGTGPLK